MLCISALVAIAPAAQALPPANWLCTFELVPTSQVPYTGPPGLQGCPLGPIGASDTVEFGFRDVQKSRVPNLAQVGNAPCTPTPGLLPAAVWPAPPLGTEFICAQTFEVTLVMPGPLRTVQQYTYCLLPSASGASIFFANSIKIDVITPLGVAWANPPPEGPWGAGVPLGTVMTWRISHPMNIDLTPAPTVSPCTGGHQNYAIKQAGAVVWAVAATPVGPCPIPQVGVIVGGQPICSEVGQTPDCVAWAQATGNELLCVAMCNLTRLSPDLTPVQSQEDCDDIVPPGGRPDGSCSAILVSVLDDQPNSQKIYVKLCDGDPGEPCDLLVDDLCSVVCQGSIDVDGDWAMVCIDPTGDCKIEEFTGHYDPTVLESPWVTDDTVCKDP